MRLFLALIFIINTTLAFVIRFESCNGVVSLDIDDELAKQYWDYDNKSVVGFGIKLDVDSKIILRILPQLEIYLQYMAKPDSLLKNRLQKELDLLDDVCRTALAICLKQIIDDKDFIKDLCETLNILYPPFLLPPAHKLPQPTPTIEVQAALANSLPDSKCIIS